MQTTCQSSYQTIISPNDLDLGFIQTKRKRKLRRFGRTTLICTGIFTPSVSESKSDIAFMIANGSIGAKIAFP